MKTIPLVTYLEYQLRLLENVHRYKGFSNPGDVEYVKTAVDHLLKINNIKVEG